MSSILQTLKTVAIKRQKHQSPIARRRNKLLDSLHLQIAAAEARKDGRQHTVKRLRRIKNKETGERIDIAKDVKVRESWWSADDGKFYFEIRYGYKALEISKGKTTIEIGEFDTLVPTLNKLKLATEQGEFDAQLESASSKLGEQLKARKAEMSK
jgi:hypothetical protein